MVGTTRVPLILDELYSRLSTHPELAGVVVLDGPAVSGDHTRDVIVLGLGDGENADVMVTRSGPRSYEEAYAIGLVISSFSGAGISKTARDQVARVLSVLEDILTTDLTLRDTCGLIALGPSIQWRQIPSAAGVQVRLTCTITANVAL
jgi:hypothetical protein